MGQPAPGWFPDPFDPARERWWDGERWTTRLQPAEGWPVYPAPQAPVSSVSHLAPQRRRHVAAVALAAAGVMLLGGAVATAGGVLALVPPDPAASPASAAAAPAPTTAATIPPDFSGGATSPPVAVPPVAPVPSRSTPHASATPRPSRVAPSVPPRLPVPANPAGLVPVVSVVDGDTITVRLGGVVQRVRLIGVDAPELPRGCYARQAADETRRLVLGRDVRLVRDPTQPDRDRQGRLLRHVALPDGRQAAQVLIAGGFGTEQADRRGYTGQRDYRAAERAARAAERGVWSSACRATGKAARDAGWRASRG